MQARAIVATALVSLCVLMSAALAQQATPVGPLPQQVSEAKNHLQIALIALFSRIPDAEVFQNRRPADIARFKGCVIQGMIADIPEESAERISNALSKNPPQTNDAVETWIFGSFTKDSARRRQVAAAVGKVCPDFKDSIS